MIRYIYSNQDLVVFRSVALLWLTTRCHHTLLLHCHACECALEEALICLFAVGWAQTLKLHQAGVDYLKRRKLHCNLILEDCLRIF